MNYPYSSLFQDVQLAKGQLEQVFAPGPDTPGDQSPGFEIGARICKGNCEEYEVIGNGSTSLCL
ncbi:MAG: hypothetical protein JO207_04685 [Verrucomicrobia bacterium]|jgi:hypothetical protein|nr:hypothetical protein [Verrucomicrobiota bacterium]